MNLKQHNRFLNKYFLLALAMFVFSSPAQAVADWEPKGPIKLWIGFGAGGGTDIQARNLAKELEDLKGWRVIPENKAGAGGAVMAAALKGEKADGQTIGLAINNTFDFAPISNKNLSVDDFTYIVTTSASQMAILARTDSGWKSLDDMVKAAKGGKKIVWASYGAETQLATNAIAKHLGINVNHLTGKGGKSGVNALVSEDANVAWAGGAQRGLVESGVLTVLASAEDQPLVQAPNGKTLRDYGMDYNFGFKFVLVGPKGMKDEARDAIAGAVTAVLNDTNSETRKFVDKQYPPGPVIIAGDALENAIKSKYETNVKLLEAISK